MHQFQDCWFGHEKLEVYREAVAFVAWLSVFPLLLILILIFILVGFDRF